MITRPPIEKLTKIAGNKYVLCCATAKRAKYINENNVRDELITNAKAISTASQELAEGKTEIIKEDI